MAKKSKKTAKSAKTVSKVSVPRKVSKKPSSEGLSGLLFRRYDNNVAFTLIVSCAAYVFFMMVSTVLSRNEAVINWEGEQIAAIQRANSEMGTVAGVSTEKE